MTIFFVVYFLEISIPVDCFFRSLIVGWIRFFFPYRYFTLFFVYFYWFVFCCYWFFFFLWIGCSCFITILFSFRFGIQSFPRFRNRFDFDFLIQILLTIFLTELDEWIITVIVSFFFLFRCFALFFEREHFMNNVFFFVFHIHIPVFVGTYILFTFWMVQ